MEQMACQPETSGILVILQYLGLNFANRAAGREAALPADSARQKLPDLTTH
jgi:hypothetical protein